MRFAPRRISTSVVSGEAVQLSVALPLPGFTRSSPIAGGVESKRSPNGNEPPAFPAWSWQEPLTLAPGESGPAYVACVQLAIPEVASLPRKPTTSGWLYQPFPALSTQTPPTTASTESGPA